MNTQAPENSSYDVVIIGGAMMGASAAWFLSDDKDFDGRVLVVDGGGSTRCAMVGDILAPMGADNGWSGIIVYGCIRDSGVFATIDHGVKAMGTLPRKSVKKGEGEIDIPVHFADVDFVPGHYAYADEDGIILSAKPLV